MTIAALRTATTALALGVVAALSTTAAAQTLQGFSIAAPPPPLSSSGEKFRTSARPIVGRYIIVLKPTAARLDSETTRLLPVSEVARKMAKDYGATLLFSYGSALRGFAVQANDNALAYFIADSRVEYVQEDGITDLAATQFNPTWGLDRIDQRNLPLDARYTYDTTASNVHAYVIDTGVRATHSEFAGRIGNGFSVYPNDPATADCNGHGTHVAGTLAGTTWGVAKGAIVHPVRAFDCFGGGVDAEIVRSIDWVARNHAKPAIVNLSMQTERPNAAIDDAVRRLVASGVTVVVSAGNVNINACQSSPGRLPEAITVGASDLADKRSIWQFIPGEDIVFASNYGGCVDLFAPGTDIRSAIHTDDTDSHTISGTSMAAPHVAGAAALYLATNPAATPVQVAHAIKNNATPNKITQDTVGAPAPLLHVPASGGGAPANLPFRREFGGGWYDPETEGQGLLLEVNATLGMVFGGWYTFDASGQNSPAGQRWYTLQGPFSPNDTSRSFTVYRNTGGNFDATPVTEAVPVGTATLSFQSCTSGKLQYQVDLDGVQRNGTIPLTRLDNNPNCTTGAAPTYDLSQQGITPGLNGAWYDAATPGQGLQVFASPANGNLLFLAWYTYEVDGQYAPGATGQRWFTVLGNYTPGMRGAYGLQVLRTTGGTFDSAPRAQVPVQVGTVDIEFHSCSSASLTYNISGRPSRTIALNRLTADGDCME